MSGIVGILDLEGEPVDRAVLERMTRSMTCRGPDAQETWVSGAVGFGHTLLRTTPESAHEHQPLTIDGLTIVADARVDARPALVKALADRGRRQLDGLSDVHLILHAYRAWDDACVDHLIGDFAFAIWDAPRRRLFCARDQFGVKPFFYARAGSQLIVSNTLDCIRRHPGVSSRLNDTAIADFLMVTYNRDPATTVFADIRRLKPAHVLVGAEGDVRTRQYWTLPIDDRLRYRRKAEYIEHFQEVFGAAVADRLRTDRAGVFMSGGVDSPGVAVAAKRDPLARIRNCDVRAYTIVYDRLIRDEERKYATLVADALRMPIDCFPADDYAPFGHWDDPGCQTPEPSLGPFAALGRDHYRRVSADCRVALTGYGADPLFLYQTDVAGHLKAGRLWPIATEVAESLVVHRRLPPIGVRTTLRRFRAASPQPVVIPPWIAPDFVKRMNMMERYRPEATTDGAHVHPVRPDAYRALLSLKWAISFEAQDPAVVGVPLESRHPFFDVRVVRYLLSIPPVPWMRRKQLLREALLAELPEAVRRRPKTPLVASPLVEWLRDAATRRRVSALVPQPTTSYLAPDAFPLDLNPARADLWSNLRPLSLEYWLRRKNLPELGD